MPRASTWIRSFLLALCSCKGDPCDPEAAPPPPPPPTEVVVEPQPPEDGEICLDESRQTPSPEVCDELCPSNRRVGWGGDCSSKGGWKASTPPIGSIAELEHLPAESRERFAPLVANICVYEWEGRGPAPELPGTEPDCRVVGEAPASSPRALVSAFDSTIDRPRMRELVRRSGAVSQHPVMVAVIDTAPWSSTPSTTGTGDPAIHGHAMAAIVRSIACASARQSCARTVETFVGLPRRLGQAEPDYTAGGFFGYQSDLAVGIWAALAEWKTREKGTKLVINLSVGWEPTCSKQSTVVREAIRQATEAGALVLAASGNRRIGSCVEGPVAPGAWTDLVHAVTPVDDEMEDLATFRPGSNAEIAAHGFMAVVEDAATPRTYGPISGSSVSTAVVSGIAALAWSYAPQLSADDLMNELWTSGEARERSPGKPIMADFSRGSAPREQRVVSACRALVGILGQDSTACAGSDPERVSVRAAWVQTLGEPKAPLNLATAANTVAECPWCSNTVLPTTVIGTTNGPALPDPWLVPQPDNPACPKCGITGKTARLARGESYTGMDLRATTIVLWDATQRSRVIQYGDILPRDGQEYTVENADFQSIDGNGSPAVRAYVYLTFDEKGQTLSVGNEIPVVQ